MVEDTVAHEDILKMAAECGFPVNWQHPDVRAIRVKRFVDFAALVAAAEREACAKVAERYEPDEKTSYVTYASSAIRARGEK